VLREFQIAIEACLDIAAHIISEKGWKSPEKYRDIVDILVKNKIIPEDYGRIFKKIIAFRNIIVHEYLEVDLKIVYQNLNKLNELREFAHYIENFLESNKD